MIAADAMHAVKRQRAQQQQVARELRSFGGCC
jgi:hypothetical protein